jgi:hypothetical protein
LALFAVSADAQRRPRRPAPKPTPTTVAPLEVRAAREKTTVQRDNVNLWINKLGPVAEAYELLDVAYAKKKPRESTRATHEANKQKFVAILRNIRDDLAQLESEFRTKTALKKYLVSVQGITDLASRAEDMAIAGNFVASKQPLRDISKKLIDTLAMMR